MGQRVGRRVLHKLTERAVKAAKAPGLYGDGGGLCLQVGPTGAKSWVYRYSRGGREHLMGLGPLHARTLDEAREKAREARQQLVDGVDPLQVKQERLQGLRAAQHAPKVPTFAVEASHYIAAHKSGWKSPKHQQQWINTLRDYAEPIIGSVPADRITTDHVLAVLRPIWQTKTETATRVRMRIEAVLDYAKVLKHRDGENPARWRGHLDKLLPRPTKVATVEHHAALPYAEVPAFMRDLRAQAGIAALAVEVIILTAARTSEVFNMEWTEVDLDAALWSVPAARMKAGKPHEVPLSTRAVEVLRKMAELGTTGYVFKGGKEGKPLSNMAGLKLLERMKRSNVTVHGFRSSFRDWAGEQTAYAREVIEHALAHQIPDRAEAAYARGTLMPKRAKLMQAWCDYCECDPAQHNVHTFKAAQARA